MIGDVPNPQYCTNVLLMFFRTALSCNIYQFYFCFVFKPYTNLCFDTVTLKKSKLYKVSDTKRRKKLLFLFHFAFLYMYFVPKVLFTSVNNSVSSAICFEILTVFRIRPCSWGECVGLNLYPLISEGRIVQYCLYYCPLWIVSRIRPHLRELRCWSVKPLPPSYRKTQIKSQISSPPQWCSTPTSPRCPQVPLLGVLQLSARRGRCRPV